jgi:hypothetical protein
MISRRTSILICLLIITLKGYSQSWKQQSIDKNVSVKFPKTYITLDTLDVQVMISPSEGVSVTKIPGALKLKDEDALKNSYKGCVQDLITNPETQFYNEKIVNFNGIIGKRFLCGSQGNDQMIDVIVVYIQKCVYAFQFIHTGDIDPETIWDERNLFFESITFSKTLSLKDQISGD